MKRELISMVIGAGIMGAVWTGSVYLKSERTDAPPDSETSMDVQHPGRMKKPVNGVYSTLSDNNFPGLELYSTDFLIPLNRLHITSYIHVDDPKEYYGRLNHPMCACLFQILENDKEHSFLVSAMQDGPCCSVLYLGVDINVEKVEYVGQLFWHVRYQDKYGRTGRAAVPVSAVTGEDPIKDMGIAQEINMNPLAKYAERCDPFVWEMNAEQFWRRYRQAIRENDRMTVAKMHDFPIKENGIWIYTRAEFVEQYESIYPPEIRDSILNHGDTDEIIYRWDGAGAYLPNGEYLPNAFSKDAPAGPL